MTYSCPITSEYITRGCRVKIDAASSQESVSVEVTNLKTGFSTSYVHVLLPYNNNGYTERDIRAIHDNLNNMLDQYGETECNEIHFTNQILS